MTGRLHPSRPVPVGVALAAAVMLALPSLADAQSRPRSSTANTASAAQTQNTPGTSTTGADASDTDTTTMTTGTGGTGNQQRNRRRPGQPAADAAEDMAATGVNPRARRLSGREEDAPELDLSRMNLRESSLDGVAPRLDPNRNDAPGMRLGTMILRPSVTQSIATERQRYGDSRQNRNYLQTELRGNLSSDWSRHALTVTGDGVFQRNISGEGEERPSVDLNADLRLDLAGRTTAHIRGGYNFTREDTDDPNAVSGASTQAGVHVLRGGLEVQREFGAIRGTTGFDLEKRIYTDATLDDGTKLSMDDRDRLSGTLRGRIGYELSPAIIPFLEASIERSRYDLRTDRLGYARSFWTYAGRSGIELDMGEKLRGEVAAGYTRAEFDDARLQELSALTLDGNLAWSPQRGTDVTIGLRTTIEPSTSAGQSGYVAHTVNLGLSHEVRDNVVARLTGGTTFRDYQDNGGDETVYSAGPGVTVGLNRFVDLTGDVGYELTRRQQADDTRTVRAMVGVTLKR